MQKQETDIRLCPGSSKKQKKLSVSNRCPHQEPVDVHEQQCQEKSVEEEVEGDAGDRLETGHAGGIQHLEREPVETEPEPERDTDRNTQWK